jgi:hypothetical protein
MGGGRYKAPPTPGAPNPAEQAYKQAANVAAAAGGTQLADLFEYRLKAPVTLAKDRLWSRS